MGFNYFYGSQADQFSFIRIPKVILTEALFSSLSIPAKVLYGVLLDRMTLSRKAAYTKQVPTVMALMESESPVITSERMKDDIEATAFQNGYVIYQNGNRATVFSPYGLP